MGFESNEDETQVVAIIDDDADARGRAVRSLGAVALPSATFDCVAKYLLWESSGSPGCVLVSMSLPGMTGMELLEALVRRECAPVVIMMTSAADVAASVRAMKAGAADVLTKPFETVRLTNSVQKALALDRRRRIARRDSLGIHDRYATLNDIERTIFHGIVSGRLNKQLAVDISICERTIKTHRARVMSKLQVGSVVELTRAAMMLGVLGEYRGRTGGGRKTVGPQWFDAASSQAF